MKVFSTIFAQNVKVQGQAYLANVTNNEKH